MLKGPPLQEAPTQGLPARRRLQSERPSGRGRQQLPWEPVQERPWAPRWQQELRPRGASSRERRVAELPTRSEPRQPELAPGLQRESLRTLPRQASTPG
jgi:hypothetical protein